jgi:hypothetical protein
MRFLKVMKLQGYYNAISKLSGTKLTGQTIDLSQFNKPKRKKRRAENPNGVLVQLVRQTKIKGKGLF